MDTPPPSNIPPASPTPPPPPPPSSGPSEFQWKMILHISGLAGMVFPLGNILGPLIIWMLKKQDTPSLDPVGKDVLNFQISYTIYIIASVIIAGVASCLIIPIALPFVACIAWLVLTIIGAVKASNGETYVFPLTIKFLA